ncbi:melanocortin receptor 3-like [Oculina patagonica]
MAKSACDEMLKFLPSTSEFDELNSTYIANCVFNSFLSYTAVMLNTVTILAIRKTSSLPKPLKTLLLSLAVSDFGVGFLVQPFYISLLVKWSQVNHPNCVLYKVFIVIMALFSLASFFGIVAISVDRFLAIHLHLRYQELVIHKRVVAVVISIWVLCAFLSLMPIWSPTRITFLIWSTTGIACLLVTTIIYWRMYLVLRRHKNQMQAVQVQVLQPATQNVDMANFASLRKSAVVVFYVYLVFLACYLPRFLILAANRIHGPSIALKRSTLFSWTLVFLNSSLNPLVYCWKMRYIRQAILDVLRNIIHRHSMSKMATNRKADYHAMRTTIPLFPLPLEER